MVEQWEGDERKRICDNNGNIRTRKRSDVEAISKGPTPRRREREEEEKEEEEEDLRSGRGGVLSIVKNI